MCVTLNVRITLENKLQLINLEEKLGFISKITILKFNSTFSLQLNFNFLNQLIHVFGDYKKESKKLMISNPKITCCHSKIS